MKYDVIQNSNLNDLVTKVQEKVAEGWQPLGPAQGLVLSEWGTKYFQTLVKGMETVVRGPTWTGGPR